MANLIQRISKAGKRLSLITTIASCLGGCSEPLFEIGGEKGEPNWGYFQPADPSMPLIITNPVSGSILEDEWTHLVQGVGYREGMELWVKTDKWYSQGGVYEHHKNGSWYDRVYLKGWGQYNNHTIRAIAPNGEQFDVTGIKILGQD